MANRHSNGHEARLHLLISNLPTGVKRTLAEELDLSGKWRDLAKEMNFGSDTIQSIEDQMQKDDISATIELLDRWATKNPSVEVDDLFIFLGKFEHKTAMLMLKDYVTPSLIALIPNISQRETKQLICEAKNLHGRLRVQPEIVVPSFGYAKLPNPGQPMTRPVFPNSASSARPLFTANGVRPYAPYITNYPTAANNPAFDGNKVSYVHPTGQFERPTFGNHTYPMHPQAMFLNGHMAVGQTAEPTASPFPPHSQVMQPPMVNSNGRIGHLEHLPLHGPLPPSPPSSASSSHTTRQQPKLPSGDASTGDNTTADSDSDDDKAAIMDEERRRLPAAVPSAPDDISNSHLSEEEAALTMPQFSLLSTMRRQGIEAIGGTLVHQPPCTALDEWSTERRDERDDIGQLIPPTAVPPLTALADRNFEGPSVIQPETVPEPARLPDDMGYDNRLAPPPYSLLPDDDHVTEQATWAECPVVQPELSEPVDRSLMSFEYQELKEATRNFSTEPTVMIGEGGYGTVYRANLSCGNYVVKRFYQAQKPEAVLLGLQTVDHFVRELEALVRYRHNNLLPLIGYSQDGPQLCLVYEYMFNGDLATWLFSLHGQRRYRGVLTAKERLNIANDTAKALKFLHNAPIQAIHCNVRSSNILLDEHMSPHLADFGHVRQKSALSSHGDRQTQLHTRSRYMVSSAAYTDPELHRSKVDPLVDVYSLGVVMLEMLTGSRAADFDNHGAQPDLISTMEEPIYGARECPDELLRKVDATFDEVSVETRLRFAEVIGKCLDERKARLTSAELVTEFALSFSDLLSPC